MKKLTVLVIICVGLLSCQTTHAPIDRGIINPDGISEAELVTLITNESIDIRKIDGKNTNFNNETHDQHSQTVKINPGVHTFDIYFNNGAVFTVFPKSVVANLEQGKTYYIKGEVIKKQLKISFIDTVDKNDVVLDMNQLQGNSQTTTSLYIKYILNPTMEKSNRSVQIENDKTIICFNPDMTFSMTDKEKKTETMGYSGFNMSFSMNDAKVYLLETDVSKMTKDDFLNKSNYVETAQTVLIPIKCTETSVTYKYVRPVSLVDQEISFSIKQKQ